MVEDFLREEARAEDILLGSLGYGEGARLIAVERTGTGYSGKGRFTDGEVFEFSADWELSELENWALDVLTQSIREGQS